MTDNDLKLPHPLGPADLAEANAQNFDALIGVTRVIAGMFRSSDQQEAAFSQLDAIEPAAAQNAARQILVRMVAITASNPHFRYGLHKATNPGFAAVITCSGYQKETAAISIKADGSFEATFGDHFNIAPENTVAGDGNKEEDLTRLVWRIQTGRHITTVNQASPPKLIS